MATRRINSYIFRETLTPTLLSLVIFTFLLIMGRLPDLTKMVVNKGVPLVDILKLFCYLLPELFTITIPISVLLGVLLAFSRLASDSEFIALKSSGVSLYSLLMPTLLFSLACVLLTGTLTLYGKPAGKTAFRDQIFTIASDKISIGIEAGVFNDSFEDLVLYAEEIDDNGGQMRNVFLSDERSAKGTARIFAKQGRFIRNQQQQTLTLRLKQGTIHHLSTEDKKSYQTIGFSSYDINLDINKERLDASARGHSISEYLPRQLLDARREATSPELANRLSTEFHKRISTSATPLVFALIGIPLALQSNRSGKGAGFALALGIALCYFLLLSLVRTFAAKGFLPAYIALYIPNFIFLAGGIFFIHRTAVEKPIRIPLQRLKKIYSKIAGKDK